MNKIMHIILEALRGKAVSVSLYVKNIHMFQISFEQGI